MSAGDDSAFAAPFSGLRFPVWRVPSAYCFRCPVSLERASCDIDCVEPLAQLLEEKHSEIAAVIVEPLLQGAGGMIVHPVEFLQRVRRLCTQHNVLLIADEVLTGFGRCGRMFACEVAGVEPDIMCLSKGLTGGFLPMGATLSNAAIREGFRSRARAHTFFHGHSYTANPLACAAGIASLKIFESERIHAERLPALESHPSVGDVRSIGTVAAIELDAEDAGYLSGLRPFLYDFFLQKGVLLRPLGNIVYILPPYVITPAELHFVYDVIAEALDRLPAR